MTTLKTKPPSSPAHPEASAAPPQSRSPTPEPASSSTTAAPPRGRIRCRRNQGQRRPRRRNLRRSRHTRRPRALAKQVHAIVGDRLDILVLNAGVSKAARIADYKPEDLDTLFATNVRGPFFLVQQLLPVPRRRLQHRRHHLHRCRPCHRQTRHRQPISPRLRLHQRRVRNTRQKLGRHPRRARHPRQRRRTRRHRHRHVQLHQDRSRPRSRARHAGIEAHRQTRRRRRRSRLHRIRRRPLDHRRQHPRRRRLQTLAMCGKTLKRFETQQTVEGSSEWQYLTLHQIGCPFMQSHRMSGQSRGGAIRFLPFRKRCHPSIFRK